jgi:hypothetical protein
MYLNIFSFPYVFQTLHLIILHNPAWCSHVPIIKMPVTVILVIILLFLLRPVPNRPWQRTITCAPLPGHLRRARAHGVKSARFNQSINFVCCSWERLTELIYWRRKVFEMDPLHTQGRNKIIYKIKKNSIFYINGWPFKRLVTLKIVLVILQVIQI